MIRSGLQLKPRKISALSSMKSTSKSPSVSLPNLNLSKMPEDLASREAIRLISEQRHGKSGCSLTVHDLSKVLLYVGETMELRHNNTFTDVLQQLNVKSVKDVNLRRLFMVVAKEMFHEEITWARVVAFFAFSGGLAVDCVLNGSPISVARIKGWMVEVVETDLVEWIQLQGGWVSTYYLITV